MVPRICLPKGLCLAAWPAEVISFGTQVGNDTANALNARRNAIVKTDAPVTHGTIVDNLLMKATCFFH